MDKTAQNIQDSFLNTARKEKTPITIYLMSGVKLTGRIRSFDKYSVVLESNIQEQLIFKHAISTVVMGRALHPAEGRFHERTESRAAVESKPVAATPAHDAPATTASQG
jgi:host factor-I protein